MLIQSPHERFMSLVASLAASRPEGASWDVYERLKADFQRTVPNATPQQYEQATQAIARAAGV